MCSYTAGTELPLQRLRRVTILARMTRARFRLLYLASSLLLVLSSAWNVRAGISAKIDARTAGTLRPVVTVQANNNAELVIFRTQNRGFQLTACKKGRAVSWLSLLLLFMQATLCAALVQHSAFSAVAFKTALTVYNKYKSVITYLQTLL